MKLISARNAGFLSLAMIVIVAVSNCSSNNPLNGAVEDNTQISDQEVFQADGGRNDQWTFKFSGNLTRVDEDHRVLTFGKSDMIVFVPENVRARLLPESIDASFRFSDLRVGVFVTVFGDLDEDHNLVAKIIEF